MLRFIPTFAHAVADYVLGSLLLFAPWIMAFPDGPARYVTMAVGLLILGASAVTKYELAVLGLIPVPAHLLMDGLGGLLLIASPWLFGFAGEQWMFQVIAGVLEVGLALTTKTTPAFWPGHQGALLVQDGGAPDSTGSQHP